MIAVLTGDLVDSTRLTSAQYKQAISGLNTVLENIKGRTQCHYELFRGDGFQVVFPEPEEAVQAMFTLRLFLNSQIEDVAINCTQALAYGTGELSKSSPGTSTGEAFIQSGRALDNARGGEFRVIQATVTNAKTSQQPAIDIMCSQLSYVLNRLSKKQADLLYQYISQDFPKHQVLADNNHTSRQNISERLKAAGGDLLVPFINYINALKDEA